VSNFVPGYFGLEKDDQATAANKKRLIQLRISNWPSADEMVDRRRRLAPELWPSQ
jgi:hypothetical protein